jgi:sugar phosphate isomerase/epimerase
MLGRAKETIYEIPSRCVHTGWLSMLLGGRAYRIEDVERIGALGLGFAEINLLRGGSLLYQPKELQRAAAKWDLHYVVHAHNEGDPRELERLRGSFYREVLDLIDACVKISAPLLTVHFWMDSRFISPEIIEGKRQIIWAMARAGAMKGIQVCLENLSEGPDDIAPVMAGCPELGITLDVGHAQFMADGNRAVEFLSLWPERVLHVHVHDNRGGKGVEDDLHLPIGEGVIDFASVFSALDRSGYCGRVTLEVPIEHLAASVDRVQRLMAAARLGATGSKGSP